jgi:general secretion pathway protein G
MGALCRLAQDSRRRRARPLTRGRIGPWPRHAATPRPNQRGFTLIEVLIIIGLIGILSTLAVFLYSNYTYQAQVARAIADIATIESEISTFEMMNLRLPNDLGEIRRATFLDPWGHPYQYLNFAVSGMAHCRKDRALHPLNTEYDLYSMGLDGRSQAPLTAHDSEDDVIRANDGQFVNLAANY